MKRNFEFDHFTIVRWGDRFIDLHNAYDLEHFGTDMGGHEVKLSFSRNHHAINPNSLPSSVTLTCSGKVRVAFNNLSAIAAPLAHEGIEIGYFDEDCDWDSFLEEQMTHRQEPQGLHVSFINGLSVRIFCEDATLVTQ